VKWLDSVLAHFGHAPDLPPESQALHEDAKDVIRVLKGSEIRVSVRPRNARARAEIRRLESHARR